MARATFLVTFDTELLWDLRAEPWSDADAGAAEYLRGEGLPALLAMLDGLRIPATFAIVGHLLLGPGEARIPQTLLDQEAADKQSPRGWYSSLAEDVTRRPEGLYWPALVDLLGGASQRHEIGVHTLTHRLFDEALLSAEAARLEIGASADALGQAFGRRPTAVVFPRNKAGYLAELRQAGMTVFRGRDETWWSRISGPAGKVAHLTDRFLALPPPVYAASRETADGLIDVPGSMLMLARSGLRRYIPLRSRYAQAAKGVAAAVAQGGIFHLWMHPIDLGYDKGPLLACLGRVLALMAAAVEDGRARFATMSTAAEERERDL